MMIIMNSIGETLISNSKTSNQIDSTQGNGLDLDYSLVENQEIRRTSFSFQVWTLHKQGDQTYLNVLGMQP